MKVIHTTLLLLCTYISLAQTKPMVLTNTLEFVMEYPVNPITSYISTHFGYAKNSTTYYNNESTTISTAKNAKVYCNVDTATVTSILNDEGTSIIFLRKHNYIIVLANLKNTKVAIGQCITMGTTIGDIAVNEMDKSKGLVELMLFKNNKVINPELYLRKVVNSKSVVVVMK